MKIALINPPVRDFYNTPSRRQPLGLLYLAGALMSEGHEVKLLDSGSVSRARRIPIPDTMEPLIPPTDSMDQSPFKLFGRYYHFGPSYESLCEEIQGFQPDLVGISSLFSAYGEEALRCAEWARKAAPRACLVAGGGHPSSLPRLVLKEPSLDYLVIGEGEWAMASLARSLDKGEDPSRIPGLAGEGFQNPPSFENDLSRFPRPARALLDLEAYRIKGRPMTQILSSRGCPYGCAFCSAHLTSGKKFRARDPADVVDEMKECRDRFGIEVFDFEDDNLTCHAGRAITLMNKIVETFGERSLRLEAMNGISMKGLTRELLQSMARAGFRTINLSPLSAVPEVRTMMARPELHEEALHLPRLAAELGLRVTTYLMVGYPDQSLHEIMESLDRWAREPMLLAPSPFYPAPGSKIQKARFPELDESEGRAWEMMRSSLFPTVPGGLKRRELRTLFWLFRVASFSGAVVPRKELLLLEERISALKGTWKEEGKRGIVFHSSKALDPRGRGLAALKVYLEKGFPHGIRLLRRGGEKAAWEYQVFPLEEMIPDKAFYHAHPVPGFIRSG